MKRYNYSIWLGYLVAMAIFIYLNDFSFENGSIITAGINIALFLIVFLVYANITIRFYALSKIEKELKNARKFIVSEYERNKKYLWNEVKDRRDFFQYTLLKRQFNSYREEMERLERSSGEDYHCDIENYINTELIDDVVHKNMFNLVPGAMTGLGILGTFVGLSFGLQSFNTGTSEAIMESITPLMEGIKTAFHTSIYGMVFSLTFSYFYRGRMEVAYKSVNEFLECFRNYVCPDVMNDGFGKLLSYQRSQDTVLNKFSSDFQAFKDESQSVVNELIIPQFERMTLVMEQFVQTSSDRQVEGMNELVNNFVSQMNSSLGEGFNSLGQVLKETCENQKSNDQYMKNILLEIKTMTDNVHHENELSSKIVEDISSYIASIEEVQKSIREGYESLQTQIENSILIQKNQEEYLGRLANYQKEISQSAEELNKKNAEYTETLKKSVLEVAEKVDGVLSNIESKVVLWSQDFSEKTMQQTSIFTGNLQKQTEKLTQYMDAQENALTENMDELSKLTKKCIDELAEISKAQIEEINHLSTLVDGDLSSAAAELGKQASLFNESMTMTVGATFNEFDKSLADIAKHLSGTIARVNETTDRVPAIVSAAYDGLEKSFREIQKEIDALTKNLKSMDKKLTSNQN